MLEIIAVLCLIGAFIVLVLLSAIDLKHGILPNKLVLSFAVLGSVFHAASGFAYFPPVEMAMGAVVGGGLLYAIRAGAIRFYGEDALGLGDVKLLAAGGIWLGVEYVLVAITLGALAGFLHGLGLAVYRAVKTKTKPDLHRLSLPAGPGFAVGLIAAVVVMFWP